MTSSDRSDTDAATASDVSSSLTALAQFSLARHPVCLIFLLWATPLRIAFAKASLFRQSSYYVSEESSAPTRLHLKQEITLDLI